MAYAVTDDVLARAGRVAGAFQQAGKHPDLTDVAKFLTDTAAEIDAAIKSRGFDPAALDQTVKDAFKDLNAYGALARALAAIPSPPQPMLDDARTLWDTGVAAITDGRFAAIAELEAGVGGGPGISAGSFATDDPTYGMNVTPQQRLGLNPYQAPLFEKTQNL